MVSNHFSFWEMGRGQSFGRIVGVVTSLIEAYPSLFTIACAKNAWVGDVWSAKMGGRC